MFAKEDFGLPVNGIIFCCFNNAYKFNPQILDSWSKILLEVESSILWIPENNNHFKANMSSEFNKRGIDPSRIIFAQRMELMSDHLARCTIADIFLDTHPYNAHTTTLDFLKVGVPVLTLIGESFASRVAASLLNTIGLPELITNTQDEYVALAIELAKNSEKLSKIKQKLIESRLTTPLFDTPKFARHIEKAYMKIMERFWDDLPPEHIYIEPYPCNQQKLSK
jgi:predicted O-linked N-acetylglucosamine transferase (SPINDLY family)